MPSSFQINFGGLGAGPQLNLRLGAGPQFNLRRGDDTQRAVPC